MAVWHSILELLMDEHLLWTLIHTLWQGGIISIVLLILLSQLSSEKTTLRYLLNQGAMYCIVLAAFFTWNILNYQSSNAQDTTTNEVSSAAVDSDPSPSESMTVSPLNDNLIIEPPSQKQVDDYSWQSICMIVWCLGVCLMLLRLAFRIHGSQKLVRQCQPLDNPQISELIESICQILQIRRKITVFVGSHIRMPGVVGFVRPTLLLPVSIYSGIPIKDIEAMLAHELAHIKRHDYLLHFVQMLIESLLFFNPWVWWISRQINFEREACCDQMASKIIGHKQTYAESLIAWYERALTGDKLPDNIVMAFSGSNKTHSMLERVQRLLTPKYQPILKLSWMKTVSIFLVSFLLLTGLYQASHVAVAVAGRWLTPQERVALIKEIGKEVGEQYSLNDLDDDRQVIFSGTINAKFPSDIPTEHCNCDISVRVRRHHSSGSYGYGVEYGEPFNIQSPAGVTNLVVKCDGFSPKVFETVYTEPNDVIDNLVIELVKGDSGKILFLNEDDQFIPNVSILGGFQLIPNTLSHTIVENNIKNGHVDILDAVGETLTLHVLAPGYEHDMRKNIKLELDKPYVWYLKKAEPLEFLITDEHTRKPIENAQVRFVSVMNEPGTWIAPLENDHDYDSSFGIMATTDQYGKCRVDFLKKEDRYKLFVCAEGYEYKFLEDVTVSDRQKMISLGMPLVIKGVIETDESYEDLESKEVHYTNVHYSNENQSNVSSGSKVKLENKDGKISFAINDHLWGEKINVRYAGQRQVVYLDDSDSHCVVFEHKKNNPLKTREVVFKFDMYDETIDPEGWIRIDYITPKMKKNQQGMVPKWLSIKNGMAKIDLPIPCYLQYSIDYSYGKKPIGFWFNDLDWQDKIFVDQNDDPKEIYIKTYPAGSIYGSIPRPDNDNQHNQISLSLKTIDKPVHLSEQSDYHFDQNNIDAVLSKELDKVKYHFGAIPLGGRYVIIAKQGKMFVTSEPIVLDKEYSVRQVDFVFPEPQTLKGRVYLPDGLPAFQAMVKISANVNVYGGHSYGMLPIKTDLQGRFVIESVNTDFPGDYTLEIKQPGYQVVQKKVKSLDQPVEIHLKKGHVFTGKILDHHTDRPIVGVQVTGYDDKYRWVESDHVTNHKGEFVFSTLDDKEYQIQFSQVRSIHSHTMKISPGNTSPQIFYAVIPDWAYGVRLGDKN